MTVSALLSALRTHIEQSSFADVIERIIVYGSHAEATASEDSDYDILLIVARPLSLDEHRALRAYLGIMELRLEILFDVRLIAQADLATLRGKQPFILHALQKGIAA